MNRTNSKQLQATGMGCYVCSRTDYGGKTLFVNHVQLVGDASLIHESLMDVLVQVNHLGHFLLTALLLDKLKSCASPGYVSTATVKFA